MKSQVLLLLRSLLTDVKRLQPEVSGLDRDLQTIEKRVKHEGLSFVTKTLPILLDAIQNGIETGQFTCPSNFKTVRGGSIPRLLSGLTCDLFNPITGEYISPSSPESLESLRMILSLCKKMQPFDPDIELTESAVSTFHSTDNECVEQLPDTPLTRTISSMSRVVLPELNAYEDHDYKHGPGAVYEPIKGNQKWSHLFDQLTKLKWLPSSFDMFVMNYRLFNSGISHVFGDETAIVDSPPERVSRLSVVPKTARSMRTITLEPAMLQFIQQGCNATLRSNIKKCGILSRCLDLSDQSKNQHLARVGSLTKRWSTIDLKSASDLLSITLVERCFANHPRFKQDLLDCRSTSYTCDNVVRTLRKYAGMGNATTFPVQSVAFAMVSIASILVQDGRIPSYRNCRRAAQHIRVFGDDIIIDSKYASGVCSDLESVGLRVNRDKSFLNGDFKESCGLDAFKGYDVTPVYLKYDPDDLLRDERVVQNLVSCSNKLYLKGYYAASDVIKRWVEDHYGPLPYVTSRSGHLGWRTRKEMYSFTKWCKNTHQFLVRGLVPRARSKKDPLDGYPALLKFFLTPKSGKEGYFLPLLMERGTKHLEVSSQRYSTRVTRRWVAPS